MARGMKTSTIADQTSTLVAALAGRSTRSAAATISAARDANEQRQVTGNSAASFALGSTTPTTSPLKRKRVRSTSVTPKVIKKEEAEYMHVTHTNGASVGQQKLKKARRQPAKKIKSEDGEVKIEPPPNWEEVYNTTKDMRAKILAPVDTMGCESLAEDKRSPRDRRFQTLVALMLSSQTKDTVTAVAMKNLQDNLPGGFTLESVLAVDPSILNDLIGKVGFHNNKTKFIKAAAMILRDEHNSDIPDTIDGMVALPGVGPKMAYLCMSAAWGRDEGIGVDVHVHRITNLWGWHKTNTPEETRAMLESWLPKEKWHDINHLLVGFGQTWCPPVGKKCDDCYLSAKGLCPSAVVGKKVQQKVKKAVVAMQDDAGDCSTKKVTDLEMSIAPIKAETLACDHGSIDVKPAMPDIEDFGSRHRSARLAT